MKGAATDRLKTPEDLLQEQKLRLETLEVSLSPRGNKRPIIAFSSYFSENGFGVCNRMTR